MTLWSAMHGPAAAELTSLRIQDYATMPQTGSVGTLEDPVDWVNDAYLARPNFLADDPTNSNQMWVNDLNGPLYIMNKTTKQFSTYLNFNGADGNPGLFANFAYQTNFANGLVTFQFDPDYVHNGKFYTVHLQNTTNSNNTPNTTNYPNLNVSSYGVTTTVDAPGAAARRAILVEWTDTNLNNTTFEGSARELLRMDMVSNIHPMGDIQFNPLAKPGDEDWRMMYISVGDGGAGESTNADTRRTPQLLNTLGGKVLRIRADNNGAGTAVTASPNGKYYIPNNNPFTGVANPGGTNGTVRDEIWSLGHRNVHRLSWDVDPADPNPATNNHLITNEIGLHTWEEVNIIKKGANYGYSQREGPNSLSGSNAIGTPPTPDLVTQDICTGSGFNNCVAPQQVTPIYPVVAYGHTFSRTNSPNPVIGDSVSSGYVYRGSAIPQLYGKYLFGEITTGQIFYADFAEMLAADDGDRNTMATIHSLNILWDDPNDAAPEQLWTTDLSRADSDIVQGPLFQIVEKAYHDRGGTDSHLPGNASVSGGSDGRADIRLQIGEDGELYIISKSDGMIRKIVGPERIPGDYDQDGDVDTADYDTWKKTFGTTVPVAGLWADGNEDGVVDAADYAVWRKAYSAPGSGSSFANVPEPASSWLWFAPLLALWRRRRHWVA